MTKKELNDKINENYDNLWKHKLNNSTFEIAHKELSCKINRLETSLNELIDRYKDLEEKYQHAISQIKEFRNDHYDIRINISDIFCTSSINDNVVVTHPKIADIKTKLDMLYKHLDLEVKPESKNPAKLVKKGVKK